MIKTAIIEYNEADEMLLQIFFLKISVKFKDPAPKKKKRTKKQQKFAKEFREALDETQAMIRGDIKPTGTVEQLFEEINQIADNETRKHQTV